MLEKLAKQTAVYGISTIVVRFLSYLLTPYYTRIFGQETYGIVTDIYALIPLALTLLTMGMESSYFRFSAKAEEAGATFGPPNAGFSPRRGALHRSPPWCSSCLSLRSATASQD